MGGVLIMSSSEQEYGASSDLQQLYLFRMKFRFVEVGPVVRTPIAESTARPPPTSTSRAATLAREGAKVVVTDLDDSRGQAVVAEIGSVGGEAVFLHQDVSLEESWPGIIEAAERRFGRLDVMVANAGIGIMCKAIEMSLADWR